MLYICNNAVIKRLQVSTYILFHYAQHLSAEHTEISEDPVSSYSSWHYFVVKLAGEDHVLRHFIIIAQLSNSSQDRYM